MRRKSRFWGFVFYAGLAGCAATLGGYVASAYWIVAWIVSPGYGAKIQGGAAVVWWSGFALFFGFRELPGILVVPRNEVGLEWWFHFDPQLGAAAPLWFILLALTALTVFAFLRFHRGISHGRCLKCGYDLTGNVSGRCPECGNSTEQRRRALRDPTH